MLVLMVMFVVGVRNDEFILCIVGRKTHNEGEPTISPDIVLAVPHAEGKDNEKKPHAIKAWGPKWYWKIRLMSGDTCELGRKMQTYSKLRKPYEDIRKHT